MRPSVYIAFGFGILACGLAGVILTAIDIWTHPLGLGMHLAIQIPAGFAGMLGGAWWLDRREKRNRV